MQKKSLYPSTYAHNDFRKLLAEYQCARFNQADTTEERKLQLQSSKDKG